VASGPIDRDTDHGKGSVPRARLNARETPSLGCRNRYKSVLRIHGRRRSPTRDAAGADDASSENYEAGKVLVLKSSQVDSARPCAALGRSVFCDDDEATRNHRGELLFRAGRNGGWRQRNRLRHYAIHLLHPGRDGDVLVRGGDVLHARALLALCRAGHSRAVPVAVEKPSSSGPPSFPAGGRAPRSP
jgi:hypothetical protein